MAKAFFTKINGALHPNSDHDRELLKKIPQNTPVQITYTKVRNYEFHKKYFALLNFAYDIWEPPIGPDGIGETKMDRLRGITYIVEKNFDQFREDIIIMAGFYNCFWRVDGEPRITAKSISFGSMDEIEFEKLYTATIDAVVKYVCRQYTGDSLRQVLLEAEAFE